MKLLKNKNFLLGVLLFSVVFSIFLSVSIYRLDLDFGWHIRTGFLILQNKQIPHIDWYSYTMPNFPWIAHEWLTEVFMSLTYSVFSYVGLAVIFALIGTLAVFVVASLRPIKYSFGPAVLGALALAPFIGVRPQVISLLFLAAVYVLGLTLVFHQGGQKIVWLLPVIFLFWANLHAGFIAGLLLLFLFLLISSYRYIKSGFKNNLFPQKLLIIFVISILVTLINPYGPLIYREILGTVNDNFLRQHIIEWMPIYNNLQLFLIIYLGVILGLLICLIKKVNFWQDLFIPLVFLVMGVASLRNIALFIIVSIPLLSLFIYQTSELFDPRKKNYFKKTIHAPPVIFFLIAGLILLCANNLKISARENSYYPYGAVNYLKEHQIQGRLFNIYNWGGFIIWALPENKVFIDGRMPSWRYQGKYIFKDYIAMSEDKNKCRYLLDKYNVVYGLVDNIQDQGLVNKLISNLIPYKKSDKKFSQIFDELGWSKVYIDQTAIIYKKP